MAKVLMIIAPEQFRDEELFVTKEELEKAGHKIRHRQHHQGNLSRFSRWFCHRHSRLWLKCKQETTMP